MSTSLLTGRLLYDPADLDAAEPFDDDLAITALANNALHYADESGQVRVAWPPYSGRHLSISSGSPTTGTYYRIAPFGPFPLTLKSDGTPYTLRVRLAGYATQAASITFRVAICAARNARREILANGDNVVSASTSSTSSAWLSGSSTVATLTAAQAAAARETYSTLDAVGGDRVGIEWCYVTAEVWASTTNSGAIPRLTGLYIAEHYAP